MLQDRPHVAVAVVSGATQVLLYALVAGFSPLALLSTLAVLGSGSGRANGSAFGIGFLFGQSLMLLAAFALGSAVTPDRERGHATLTALLELALGLALLVLAWRGRRPRGPVERSEDSRLQALLGRLGAVRFRTALMVGFFLGVGGVKRLTITLLAGTTIAASGLARGDEVGLAAAYVLIATLLVWGPVCIYLVAGSRADAWTERTQAWLMTNEQRARVISTLVFGLLLTADALLGLLQQA